MFICGRKSSSHEVKDKNGSNINAYSTPKTSKKSKIFSRFTGKGSTKTRNPYSDRGLDKFYTLLADLDDRKQKIYSQMGAEDVCFVRFVNSDDDDKRLKAVVVKVKNKNNNFLKLVHDNVRSVCSPTTVRDGEEMDDDRSKEKGTLTTTTTEEKKEELMKINCHRRIWNGRLSRSRYYCFAVMIVLIVLFLAIYGRLFAIFCATISWYLIPRIASSKVVV